MFNLYARDARELVIANNHEICRYSRHSEGVKSGGLREMESADDAERESK